MLDLLKPTAKELLDTAARIPNLTVQAQLLSLLFLDADWLDEILENI